MIDEHPMMGAGRGRLEGKVAIVTAADSGIGRAAARLFAREGAKIVALDINEWGEPRVDDLIRKDGNEAVFVKGDVTSKRDWGRVVVAALDNFGGLDILFNNAGGGVRKPFHELTDEEWNFVVDLNLHGTYNGIRAVLPHFRTTGSGNIVNTASSLGVLASAEYTAYSTTKAAIIMMTRQLAMDYGPEVRINCICPGPTLTRSYRGFPPRPREDFAITSETLASRGESVKGLHRGAYPEEVAYAALFLASDESSFVTGHALVVDGGQTLDA
jgi:NAD(P)-dependent dehydrogenase (short-subunit alcohol dehydrogenase family)